MNYFFQATLTSKLSMALCRATFLLCLLHMRPGFALADGLPSGPIPSGWGIQIKGHNATPETLDAVSSLGLTVVRKGFPWAGIEQKPGVFDFTAMDAFVEACHARGLRILGAIGLNNQKLYGPVTEAKGRQAYARYAAKLARRYEKYDIVWELWNEPNTRTFWGKHGRHNSQEYAAEYTALAVAAVRAIRRAAPRSTVVAGAVSSLWEPSYEWQQHCFSGGMQRAKIDGWSLHPYGVQKPEAYPEAYTRVRSILTEAGRGKLPLINSECGYKLDASANVPIHSAEQQAEYLVRQYLIDDWTGMRISIWYEWSGREGFSLHGADGSQAMEVALRTLIDELRGYDQVQRVSTDTEEDFVLLYQHPSKPPKVVAWTLGANHTLTLPGKFAGPVRGRRLLGQRFDKQPGPQNSIAVELSSAPIYLSLSEAMTDLGDVALQK